MKFTYILPLMLLATAPLARGVTPLAEPGQSALASGKWVKIRVEKDGVYELTHAKLRELGFSNPENVGVYGYAPTILLTHDLEVMPTDMQPMQSLHSNGKLLFFGQSNVDYSPELWETQKSGSVADGVNHARHAHSRGATYFLSDSRSSSGEIGSVPAPSGDFSDARTSHTAVFYHEKDSVSLSLGGAWYADEALAANNASISRPLTLNNVASAQAKMIYQSLMAPTKNNLYNYLRITYPEGFTAEEFTGLESQGFSASKVTADEHNYFSHSIRYQNVTIPVADEEKNYNLVFSLPPDTIVQNRSCALDYYALLYNRKNSLAGQPQVDMFFENWTGTNLFALQNPGNVAWQVWNVTNPGEVSRFEMTQSNGRLVGQLPAAVSSHPTRVVAFNPAATQMSPEIVGNVESQNLHAASTPEMLIITSAPLLDVAHQVADLHLELNDVLALVVDQEQIFNEYGSGNVSPEAVRRFIRHLYNKSPGRMQAVLMLGPGTIYNAQRVRPENPYVITYEIEDYKYCHNITINACIDAFFGHLSAEFEHTGLWSGRTLCARLLGMEQTVPVTRVPLASPVDIMKYYGKVREYISNPPTYPSWGNIVVSSDNATASQESHFANAEALVDSIPGTDSIITVTRSAQNYYATTGLGFDLQDNGLKDGAMFFTYFGHGANTTFGGSNNTGSLMTMSYASDMKNIGRYPFAYFGSCDLAPFDVYESGVYANLLTNTNGGMLGIIGACRSVYQEMNERLGAFFAHDLYTAENGTPIGAIWMKAHDRAVRYRNCDIKSVINHLDYNYVGDPMIPVYAPTHSARLTRINTNNAINTLGNNVIEGEVLKADGSVDSNFSGTVLLTIYDVPVTRNNSVGTGGQSKHHKPTQVMDSDVIGRYTATVTNGKFTANFIGPATSRTGSHRVQVYAYSGDGKQRGYGASTDVALNYDPANEVTPTGTPTSIDSFAANSGEFDKLFQPEVTISASIKSPRGLANSNAIVSPVRLTIDGVSHPDATKFINRKGNGLYELKYVTAKLGGGRHQATLDVLDAAGDWTSASVVFNIDNTPAANLSADYADGKVNFNLTCEQSGESNVLYIENISGTTVMTHENPTFPLEVGLSPGLYRAFVQIKGASTLFSTPKIDIFVE